MPTDAEIGVASKVLHGLMCARSLPATWTYRKEAMAVLEAAERERDSTLRDALSGLIDWCKEGCPDGGSYALVEARAALANIKPASRSLSSQPQRQEKAEP